MSEQVAVSLLDWLRTGCFGPLRLGQTRAAVALFLGPPDDVGGTSRRYRRPTIWKYGDFELYFSPGGDALSGIQTDTFTMPHGGPHVQIDPWHLRNGVAQQTIAKALISAGITYRSTAPPHLSGTTQLTTSSGVWLHFAAESIDTRETGGLCAMGQSARTTVI